MRETQCSGVNDGLTERGTSSNRHGSIEKPEISENDRRNVWAVHYLVRMKCYASIESSKKHLATRALKTSAPAGQVSPGKAVRGRVVLECLHGRIEYRQPVVCAHPQIAALVLKDAAHHISR